MLLKRGSSSIDADLKKLHDSHEHLLESFKIPILIDDGVNDSREKDLLGLVCKKIHQIVHFVNLLWVTHVSLAPLWEELLANEEHQVLDVLVVGQIHVLAGILESHLNLIHQWSAH